MTEQEWLAAKSPWELLGVLVRTCEDFSNRKTRLVACACCHRTWHLLCDERSQQAVEAAERYADGLASRKELATARAAAMDAIRSGQQPYRDARPVWAAKAAAACAETSSREALRVSSRESELAIVGGTSAGSTDNWHAALAAEGREQSLLFRDIFGNPFRPAVFSSAWRSDTAVSLAKHIYESRDFSAMPILADALQDAGCDNADILNHCRDEKQLHVRGCWVVDLVLGKE